MVSGSPSSIINRLQSKKQTPNVETKQSKEKIGFCVGISISNYFCFVVVQNELLVNKSFSSRKFFFQPQICGKSSASLLNCKQLCVEKNLKCAFLNEIQMETSFKSVTFCHFYVFCSNMNIIHAQLASVAKTESLFSRIILSNTDKALYLPVKG